VGGPQKLEGLHGPSVTLWTHGAKAGILGLFAVADEKSAIHEHPEKAVVPRIWAWFLLHHPLESLAASVEAVGPHLQPRRVPLAWREVQVHWSWRICQHLLLVAEP